jgi:hypothetical protein
LAESEEEPELPTSTTAIPVVAAAESKPSSSLWGDDLDIPDFLR